MILLVTGGMVIAAQVRRGPAMAHSSSCDWTVRTVVVAALLLASAGPDAIGRAASSQAAAQTGDQLYEHRDTRELVALVDTAAALVESNGDAALGDFRQADSRWRHGEKYVFVLNPDGDMLVHPDPALEGRNQLGLKDINGKPIVRGLLAAAMVPGKPAGWYHYQWPVPGGLLPRWKSSYVRLVEAPSGQRYVVGSGMYNDRMERAFVVDVVTSAVQRIEAGGETAYPLLRDPMGPFMAKDTYVFVIDPQGTELVNPGFPNLEGRSVLDVKDTAGKLLVRDMMQVVTTEGSGWVEYMWPKPGDSVSTQKSTYVSRAKIGGSWVLVGSGVYLEDAPTAAHKPAMTAPELMALVHDAAALLAERGANAYPELRQKGSRWFSDDTYFFVYSMSGIRVFHAANPATEGQDITTLKDIVGRPIGRAILDAAASPSGEGWIHYMYPEPGDLFPMWKSTFVSRVRFPSGELMAVGCGVYNVQIDRILTQDLVDRAAALVAARGQDAFEELRSRTGPFVFMDTYVFVDRPDGVSLVNPGQPSLEGTNLRDVQDLRGKYAAAEFIDKAMKDGSAWTEYYWYRPGYNTPARKETYVRKVQYGAETYVVGAGFYITEDEANSETP